MSNESCQLNETQHDLADSQSLAWTQIFLNASLACICWTREIIPWQASCFQPRYIGQIEQAARLHQDDLYSSLCHLEFDSMGRSQELRILVRGGHCDADWMLDMLEERVFESLRHGHLEALQIFVVEDNAHTQTLVETYCFSFKYKNGLVDRIRFEPSNQTPLTAQLRHSLKLAIRGLLGSLKNLPRLPARIKLGMSLAYNEMCPLLYQPTPFADASQHTRPGERPLLDSLWAEGGHSVGNMETSHHHVHAEIRSLMPSSLSSDMQDSAMSRYLRTMQRTSSPQSNNMRSTLRESLFKRPARPVASTRM